MAEFTITTAENGSLTPLAFVELESHCIWNADPAKSAVALCGTLLKSSLGRGHPTEKTEAAIPAGSDICISISEEAFCQLVFCAQAARVLADGAMSSLPKNCGAADKVEKSGVSVTGLRCSLNHLRWPLGMDFVGVEADLEATKDCVKVSTSVAARVSGRFAGLQFEVIPRGPPLPIERASGRIGCAL